MAFGLTIAIITAVHENKRKLAKIAALPQAEEAAAVNRAILAKLEGIELRLGALEKTLNDIPG